MRKLLVAVIMTLAMILPLAVPVKVEAALPDPGTDSPQFVNTSSIVLGIDFEANNVILSSVSITGKVGTSKIEGHLELWDMTTNHRKMYAAFITRQIAFDRTYTETYISGHRYRVYVYGYVYNAQGVGEYISLDDFMTAP